MVKAIIEFKDGTKIRLDGTPEEVAKTKELITTDEGKKLVKKETEKRQIKKGPLSLILELKGETFFDKPQTIDDVKQKLIEKTHYYPSSSLSPALIRLVKKGELGRIKKDGKWMWVKR